MGMPGGASMGLTGVNYAGSRSNSLMRSMRAARWMASAVSVSGAAVVHCLRRSLMRVREGVGGGGGEGVGVAGGWGVAGEGACRWGAAEFSAALDRGRGVAAGVGVLGDCFGGGCEDPRKGGCSGNVLVVKQEKHTSY